MKTTVRILATLLMLLTLMTFAACFDEENDLKSQVCHGSCTTITGTLTTGDGSQPLAGVEVTAKWKNTFYLAGTIRKKATTRTDNAGNYTLKFEVREDELKAGYFSFDVLTDKQYFTCVKDEYPSFSFLKLRNDTILYQNLFVPYVAHLQVTASGARNMSDNEYFELSVKPDIEINPTVCGISEMWSNKTLDGIYTLDVPANINLVIETLIYKGGTNYQRSYDTLLIDRGQTGSFSAVYK